MVVTVVGLDPPAIVAAADIETEAGQTALACVCRATPGPLTAAVTVSITSNSGAPYDSLMICKDKNGAFLPGPTATLGTDQ